MGQVNLTNELEKNLPMNDDFKEGYAKGLKELRVGAGQSFWVRNGKVTLGSGDDQIGQEAGIGSWWGAEEFDDAPARIGVDGAAVFTDVLINGRYGQALADAINSSSNLITDVINAKLDTSSKEILSDFDFGSSDYAGAVKAGDVAWDASGVVTSGSGIAVYRKGIVGANAGSVTFSISSVDGNAYFAGELAAATGTLGTLTIASNGYIQSGQTGYDTGKGFWMGKVAGVTKFSIGDASGNKLLWDGNSLALTGSMTITGGSGVANLSDAGDLAVLDDVGYTDCDTTLISGGYIATPRLYANNIQAGTFIGRTFKANNGSGVDTWIENTGYIRWRYGGGTKAFSYVNSSGDFILDSDNAMILDFNSDGGTSYGFEISEDSGSALYIGGDKSVDLADDLDVAGTLSKGGGSFKIDHPLKPKTHYLFHSFVESPDMLNIYKGRGKTKNKKAIIELPDYFEALNKDFEYQLTPIRSLARLGVRKEVKNNKFEVMSDEDCEFSWQVMGVRKDRFAQVNPIITEVEKKIKGYTHPELWEEDFEINEDVQKNKFIKKINKKRMTKLQVKRNYLKRKTEKDKKKEERLQKLINKHNQII